MGIVNVTPDSFSDGGKYLDPDTAVAHGMELVAQGADLLDIGGESTRPGSRGVSLDEELRRVLPVVRGLANMVRVPLSVDTSKAEVARQAIAAGATMVNDVTALRGDPDMAGVIARNTVSITLMHMRGDPRTMQHRPRYRDVAADVAAFLREAAAQARRAGIPKHRILVDPGLGFGKTVEHNLILMRSLEQLRAIGYPVVVGPSRKSFIGKTLGTEADERLEGTLACVGAAARQRVHMVRVHDVGPAVRYLKMVEAIDEGR
jgi:dihydropteroate synthase